nr:PREDICTED: uncharacterized protein LOC102348151 [Latimeria chalumnae]|eukprot:XP_005999526.1 PREDICTED: uncharacterized protein LOC102348151 [Latimeria chalumnae]
MAVASFAVVLVGIWVLGVACASEGSSLGAEEPGSWKGFTAPLVAKGRVDLHGNPLGLGSALFELKEQLAATFSQFHQKGPGEEANLEYQPGSPALSLRVKTLDGEFVYQAHTARANFSVLFHAFTNKSGFLECMWSTGSSIRDLVNELPDQTQLVFMSLDETAPDDVKWMKYQIEKEVMRSKKKDLLSRLHFVPIPVYELGNWIPDLLYSWRCRPCNCGLNQAVFNSPGWEMPIVVKRLDARYDWLMKYWSLDTYLVKDAGDGCKTVPEVKGAVAWVSEEGNCSYFVKVKNMEQSGAAGVLVYAGPGKAIQDMDCIGTECYYRLNIPAAMVHFETDVMDALRGQKQLNVSFQKTFSPNNFFGFDMEGKLAETGCFLYPTFKFLVWQAQWFVYEGSLLEKLTKPAYVVNIFNDTIMQGDKGAVATVELPKDISSFDKLELDAALSCPGTRDKTCPHWDHTVQLYVCCENDTSYCNLELGRWITAFCRRIGRWLTDVSPLIPLLNSTKCTFRMKTVPWAMAWMPSLNLRFSKSSQKALVQHQSYNHIQNIKMHYRKSLLRKLLHKMEGATSATEAAKSITILDAIHWINESVKKLKSSTVTKYFAKAGFVVSKDQEEEDDLEDNLPFAQLLIQAQDCLGLEDLITDPQEYASLDEDMPITDDLDDG